MIRRAGWTKIACVITGYNTDIRHNDEVFHVQTEDKGVDNPVIESLVYMGGKIIASRQYSYASLLREGYSEKAVQDLLDSQHRRMMRDIHGGKYDPKGPPPFGAGIITDRDFDEVVLGFIEEQMGAEGLELVLEGKQPVPRPGDLLVLEIAVRSAIRHAPLAGAEVSIRFQGAEATREIVLFTGVTDDTGVAKAGVQLPADLGGGMLTLEAKGKLGTDDLRLEVRGE